MFITKDDKDDEESSRAVKKGLRKEDLQTIRLLNQNIVLQNGVFNMLLEAYRFIYKVFITKNYGADAKGRIVSANGLPYGRTTCVVNTVVLTLIRPNDGQATKEDISQGLSAERNV